MEGYLGEGHLEVPGGTQAATLRTPPRPQIMSNFMYSFYISSLSPVQVSAGKPVLLILETAAKAGSEPVQEHGAWRGPGYYPGVPPLVYIPWYTPLL